MSMPPIEFVAFLAGLTGMAAFFYAIGNVRGYAKGYGDGLAYGAKGLEDYHQHTMANLQSLQMKKEP